MRSSLVALLSTEGTISSIVGSRVYIGNAPQTAAFPHIVITQIGADGFKAMASTDVLRAIDFDIDCKAKRSVESETLGNAVRTFIADYSGAAGSQSISAVLLNDESSDVEPARDGSDTHIHTTLIDVTIQYKPV